MTEPSRIARRYYQHALTTDDPIPTVLAALDEVGNDVKAVDLAALDQFHAGGIASTMRLGELLAPLPRASLLDAGSGLGGPARIIAERFACHVTGVDLTPGYVELAERLSERTGLAESVTFRVADLLSLPFGAGTFDGAYTQHVVMNIEDRDVLYAELRRVLKPGARFGFHDVVASGADGVHYPTPWAETAESSFLLNEDETVAALQRAGLRVDLWEDVTEEARGAIAAARASSSAGPTLGNIMGARFSEMTSNYARNLREGRFRVVMGRAVAS